MNHLNEPKDPRGNVWFLKKLPHGLAKGGRQWLMELEKRLLKKEKTQRIFGVIQLFARKEEVGKIMMVTPKVTDDILIAGVVEELKKFISEMCSAI